LQFQPETVTHRVPIKPSPFVTPYPFPTWSPIPKLPALSNSAQLCLRLPESRKYTDPAESVPPEAEYHLPPKPRTISEALESFLQPPSPRYSAETEAFTSREGSGATTAATYESPLSSVPPEFATAEPESVPFVSKEDPYDAASFCLSLRPSLCFICDLDEHAMATLRGDQGYGPVKVEEEYDIEVEMDDGTVQLQTVTKAVKQEILDQLRWPGTLRRFTSSIPIMQKRQWILGLCFLLPVSN